MSNVGSNEKNSSDINTTDVDFLFADTLTEWTVSGPEGGIAITPVANTEYHPLLEGGGATGWGLIRRWSFVRLVKNTIF
jgi:hypothetical protein